MAIVESSISVSYRDIEEYFKGVKLSLEEIRFINIVTRTCKNADFWLFNNSKYDYIVRSYFTPFDRDQGLFISKDKKFLVVSTEFIKQEDNYYIVLPILSIKKENEELDLTNYTLGKPYSPILDTKDNSVSFFHPRKFCNAQAAMLFVCVNLMNLGEKTINTINICNDTYKS